jgi:hypothetical protein
MIIGESSASILAQDPVMTTDNGNDAKRQLFDSCGSTPCTRETAKIDGWKHRKFEKGKNWLRVPCLHTTDNFQEAPTPRSTTQREAGQSIYVDEFPLARRARCSPTAPPLTNGGPRRRKREIRKPQGYVRPPCTNNPADRHREPADSQ